MVIARSTARARRPQSGEPRSTRTVLRAGTVIAGDQLRPIRDGVVALEAGVDTIEHCTFAAIPQARLDEALVASIAEQGKYVVPTANEGSVTTGLDADLVALEGDPLSDFDAYTRPRVVVTRGRVVGLGPAPSRPTGVRDGARGARL